ncbi:galactokinase family protein [Corynebacterium felinum]|uniref:Galactokinase n=2 Tax=Corynebacterium felinum TaxID=131318 RepID=A0ABU2BC69_9CORY|nr:galactokinase family protein [Corynebacterium felinum]MDF5820053.1 galactokinase family protein [Corynebacterium felinum]MDR7356232.1 galactokinase [Corynebacterium felinum]WJY95564.1 Galactokinase [Corynebacterium felinum]
MSVWSARFGDDSNPSDQVRTIHLKWAGSTPSAVASAPGTWSLIGEHSDYAGGVVLMTLLQLRAWVAVSPRPDSQVKVCEYVVDDRGVLSQHSTSSAPVGALVHAHCETRAQQLAGLVATMMSRQMLSRETKGVDITVVSEIPPTSGLGGDAAIEVACGLALAAKVDDLDSPPMKAKLADVCFQAACHGDGDWPLRARYTAILRGREGVINIIDYADFSITQASHPLSGSTKSKAVAIIPPHSGADVAALAARQHFVEEATRAFGAESLRLLPDASTRVIDWLKAVHQAGLDMELPPVDQARAWMEFQSKELALVQLVTQAVRSRKVTDVFPAINQSQDLLFSLLGLAGVDREVASLCLSRGAVAARAAFAGVSSTVVAFVPELKFKNFCADLAHDGFGVAPLDFGVPATVDDSDSN